MTLQKITILGSTGSIGVNTLDVIRRHPQRYSVVALCAHKQIDRLFDQCLEFKPCFAVVRDAALVADEVSSKALEADVMKLVDSRLGAVARPSRVIFVTALPKTRSGKLLRRALQAVAERRDPGDLTTMEDPAALQQVKDLVG